MKHYSYLGVNGNKCCILNTLVSFSTLKEAVNVLEARDFLHSSTNWNGCDDIERTIELKKIILTGEKLILKTPIIFHGIDYDMGHSYNWHFTVKEIWEVVNN